MPASPRYALSALGILNALGADREQVLTNLLAGAAPGRQRQQGWLPGREVPVACIPWALPEIPPQLADFDCRNSRLLLAALAQIESDIARIRQRYGEARIGVIIGSSTSGIAEGEQALRDKLAQGDWPAHYHYRQQEIGTPAEFIARHLQLPGLAMTVSTACSSSAKAFASARQWLALDLCDAVIVGGADSLCRLTLNGFTALESVSAEGCDPFAEHRDGITIGEAAALFILERAEAADARAIRLAGVGESADAHHISAPHPDGEGAERAMRAALADAGLTAAEIDYINLHGTATPLNDRMESRAVQRVFGEATPCSSTKPLTGHTLGAAGATEAGLCWLLLSAANRERVLPKQINRQGPDPELPAIALLRADGQLPTGPRRLLSNSFAFGGSNAAVILEAGA